MTNDQMIYLALEDGHSQDVTDLSFSPVGDHLVACDHSRQGRLFRWADPLWAEVRSFRGATAAAISGDGQRLAIGGSGGAVRLYSTDSGAKLGSVLTGGRSQESVLFLAWTPRDEALILLTGLEDQRRGGGGQQHLRRWDLARRRETHSAPFGESALLALSPDSRYLASIHYAEHLSPSAIHFWDLVTWTDIGWIEWDPEDTIHALAFSPDDETLAIGTHHGRIKLIPWRQLLVS